MFEAFGPEHLLPLLTGAVWTIVLCAISGVIGSIAGMILGLARTSPSRIARWISAVYINLIRGIPILVIIFFIFFGLPLLFPDLDLSKFVSAIIALSVFAAAYVAEIVRGSIEAIPKGQSEAAEALGLGYYAKFRYVIIPQAMKIVVPPGIGFLIGLVKDSSLVTVIGFIELTRAGNIVSNLTGDPITTFLVVGAMYFVICYGISLLGRWYEKRTGVHVDSPRLRLPAGI
jgi:polar amino acid transport system permease protein